MKENSIHNTYTFKENLKNKINIKTTKFKWIKKKIKVQLERYNGNIFASEILFKRNI